MTKVYLVVLLSLAMLPVYTFAQSDRGTITGTVTDQTGAAVPSATVVLKSDATGADYKSVTTQAGDYTVPSLPAGVYHLTVAVPGFKTYHQDGITAEVAQTARVDVRLEVGAASESVQVHADADLLQTDSSAAQTTIDNDRLLSMPLYFGSGQGGGAIRNPLTFATLVPGADYQTASTEGVRVNGFPTQSFTILIEGQDATNGLTAQDADITQPAMEAVQEFTLQSSNFAAEFGQVSGGLFNFTTKSGTNQYHGSMFDYFTNSVLNAGVPFTINTTGTGLALPTVHKNDYGASVGGPVRIPKLYNGKNKTFFFFNYEGYDSQATSNPVLATVPTLAMRTGNFSGILDGRNLGTTTTGSAILENTIYDPLSAYTVNGNTLTNAFPGNIIPTNRLNASALAVQALMPLPETSGNVNNYTEVYPNPKTQWIPSFKIDQNIGEKTKISFYYQYSKTDQLSAPDGLPLPLSAIRPQLIHSDTFRLNADETITPTLLFHIGIGDQHTLNPDSSPAGVLNYNAVANLGITGGYVDGMPRLSGLSDSFGGMSYGLGPTNADHYITEKPTATSSLTWVHGRHTYKAGGSFKIDVFTDVSIVGNGSEATGAWTFSNNETGIPYLQTTNIGGGTIGNPYASFLLGGADSASVSNISDPQWRRRGGSLFIQDTWKVSPKLTFDYGLRWDIESYGHELYYRESNFDPTLPNPSAGGLLGATQYEGYGPGRCNCTFAHTDPYDFGPRLGLAYQITSKTVLRAGWGIAYGLVPSFSYPATASGVGWNTLNYAATSFGVTPAILGQGLPWTQTQINNASYNPGLFPAPGTITSPPYLIDRNAGKPPRINQWNIALQRELKLGIVVEAAFVGNRGVWLTETALVGLNNLTPQEVTAAGLSLNNPANLALLSSPMSSPQVIAAGFKPPYAGFPMTLTLAQALRPFPQFGSITDVGAPLGNSWYDALQSKVTKRLGNGLSLQSAFTYSQELTTAEGGVQDIFNRALQKHVSASSQPFVLVIGYTYELPGGALTSNKFAKTVLHGWTLGGMLREASGMPIEIPAANNNLGNDLIGSSAFDNYVPGQPLFLKNLNCHCFNPATTLTLNPAAWTQPAAGQFGDTALYLNNYRGQRRPDEEMSFGRTFRLREKVSFQLRAEFFNVFNRTEMNNPSSTNAQATPVLTNGAYTSGFGYISTGSVAYGPRSGQIVAMIHW
jgi:hypothetical protein